MIPSATDSTTFYFRIGSKRFSVDASVEASLDATVGSLVEKINNKYPQNQIRGFGVYNEYPVSQTIPMSMLYAYPKVAVAAKVVTPAPVASAITPEKKA